MPPTHPPLPTWHTDHPPTLKQMELDMETWSHARHQIEAIQYEGRLAEYLRAKDAWEAILARHLSLEESLKAERLKLETWRQEVDAADQRLASTLRNERKNASEALHAAKADLAASAEVGAQSKKDLFRRLAVRRLLSRELAAGLRAWTAFARARASARRRLLKAAATLRNVEARAAFNAFASYASGIRVVGAIESIQSEMQSRLDTTMDVKKQNEEAAQREIADLTEKAAAAQNMEKDLLSQMANQAWASTQEAERVRTVHALELADAAGTAGAELQRVKEQMAASEAAAADAKAASDAELAQVRADLETERELSRAHAAEVAALTEKIASLELANAAREEQLLLEGKEGQIALFQKQIVRRLMYSDLASGFAAWVELAQARSDALSRLQTAAQRLKAPELAFTFQFWREDMIQTKFEAEVEAETARAQQSLMVLDAREVELRRLREQLQRMGPKSSGGFVQKAQRKNQAKQRAAERASLNKKK